MTPNTSYALGRSPEPTMIARHLGQGCVGEWPATAREQVRQQRQHVSLRGEQAAGASLARHGRQEGAGPGQFVEAPESWLVGVGKIAAIQSHEPRHLFRPQDISSVNHAQRPKRRCRIASM